VPCLHGHSGFPIIFNRCKYDRIFPWPAIIVVTLGLKVKFTAYTYVYDTLLTVDLARIICRFNYGLIATHRDCSCAVLATLKMATLEWPKHVGGYCVIKLHSLSQVQIFLDLF
jgi:hypothetical protein